MEADQAAFAAWERQTAVDRSAGHFFQSLYQSDKSKPVGSSNWRSSSRSTSSLSTTSTWRRAPM